MTEDLADLIEKIKRTNDENLRAIVNVFQIEDPIARFRAVDQWDVPALAWAARRARAIIVKEMQDGPEGRRSYKAIGELLGISAQRAHQLAHPDYRRTDGNRNNVRTTAL